MMEAVKYEVEDDGTRPRTDEYDACVSLYLGVLDRAIRDINTPQPEKSYRRSAIAWFLLTEQNDDRSISLNDCLSVVNLSEKDSRLLIARTFREGHVTVEEVIDVTKRLAVHLGDCVKMDLIRELYPDYFRG